MIELFSPAKINLFLRVLGRRKDGYHEIATLMQTVDFGDTLTFSLSKQDILTCSHPNLACDRSNLIWRAIDLYRKKTGKIFQVSIHLEKRIPMQAGMGGGSSNAATALYGVNALLGHPVSNEELQLWGGELGSDVPFFFSRGIAYCTGRGERIRELKPIEFQRPFTAIFPEEKLGTVDVYRQLNLEKCSKKDPEAILEGFLNNEPEFINDLEEPALRLAPSLTHLKQELENKSDQVFMTGSGSTLIATATEKIQNSLEIHPIESALYSARP